MMPHVGHSVQSSCCIVTDQSDGRMSHRDGMCFTHNVIAILLANTRAHARVCVCAHRDTCPSCLWFSHVHARVLRVHGCTHAGVCTRACARVRARASKILIVGADLSHRSRIDGSGYRLQIDGSGHRRQIDDCGCHRQIYVFRCQRQVVRSGCQHQVVGFGRQSFLHAHAHPRVVRFFLCGVVGMSFLQLVRSMTCHDFG